MQNCVVKVEKLTDFCRSCKLSILDTATLCADTDRVKRFLLEHKLISTHCICPSCGSLRPVNWRTGEYRCQKYAYRRNHWIKCNFKRSLYNGTFFNRVKLTKEQVILLVCFWVHLVPPRQALIMNQLNLPSASVVDWFSFCREVLVHWMDKEDKIIGGENEIVEIDESKIGKRKYNRGRRVEGQWVFGGVLRSDHTKCFVVPVEDRTKETLLQVIQERVAPGTIIYSDCWKAYNCLNHEGKFKN